MVDRSKSLPYTLVRKILLLGDSQIRFVLGNEHIGYTRSNSGPQSGCFHKVHKVNVD